MRFGLQIFLTVIILPCAFLTSCIISWNERDGVQGTSMLEAPIAIAAASYQAVRSHSLTVDFMQSTKCERTRPIGTFRLNLIRVGKDGERKILVDRYLNAEREEFSFTEDGDGRYEIRAYHQDFPEKYAVKRLILTDDSKVVIVDLPCIK